MRKDKIGRIDKVLLFAAGAVACLGVIFIYSATYSLQETGLNVLVIKQAIWVLVGMSVLVIIANTDYLRILDYALIAYGLNLAALIFLLMFGGERYGARRWLTLGPISLQPSEFVKITVILALAYFLGERREKIESGGTFIKALALVAPSALLIFMQPDLGTALVLVPISLAILFVCGSKIKNLVITMSLGLLSLPVLWHILKDYQKNRLMVFINPDLDPLGAGYTIIQSKIAIGSGGFLGKGLLNGTQNYLRFLPERHTDFIFSVVGEEFGYVGAILLIGLYTLIIVRGIKIANDASDVYGRIMAVGVVTLIAFQVIVNISMTIGLMPVVGLPLPAISYGGSNTIVTLAGIGLLLSVSRRVNR